MGIWAFNIGSVCIKVARQHKVVQDNHLVDCHFHFGGNPDDIIPCLNCSAGTSNVSSDVPTVLFELQMFQSISDVFQSKLQKVSSCVLLSKLSRQKCLSDDYCGLPPGDATSHLQNVSVFIGCGMWRVCLLHNSLNSLFGSILLLCFFFRRAFIFGPARFGL